MSALPTTVPEKPDTDDGSECVWKRFMDTRHKAWVQFRYHRRRQRFFDKWDKESKAFTLLLGASLFGKHLNALFPYLATGISALSLLSLVFGYGDRKQAHKEIAEQSASLAASMESIPPANITENHAAQFASEFAKLCAKMPPPLKSLTIICEIEQSIADGKKPTVQEPSWPKRLFADYY